jgi:hypothetical protein
MWFEREVATFHRLLTLSNRSARVSPQAGSSVFCSVMPNPVSFRFLENEEKGRDNARSAIAEFLAADEDGLLQSAGH